MTTRIIHHADGTEQTLMRHSPAGFSVPVEITDRPWWTDLAWRFMPRVTGGRALDGNHPSRKHDGPKLHPVLIPAKDVPGPLPGQARRRDRRAAARYAAKHYQVSGAAGGDPWESECACGVTFSAPTAALLSQVTDAHYRDAAVTAVPA